MVEGRLSAAVHDQHADGPCGTLALVEVAGHLERSNDVVPAIEPTQEDLVGTGHDFVLGATDEDRRAAVVLHGLQGFGGDLVIDLLEVVPVEDDLVGLAEGRVHHDGVDRVGLDESRGDRVHGIAVAEMREGHASGVLVPARIQFVRPHLTWIDSDQEGSVSRGGLVGAGIWPDKF